MSCPKGITIFASGSVSLLERYKSLFLLEHPSLQLCLQIFLKLLHWTRNKYTVLILIQSISCSLCTKLVWNKGVTIAVSIGKIHITCQWKMSHHSKPSQQFYRKCNVPGISIVQSESGDTNIKSTTWLLHIYGLDWTTFNQSWTPNVLNQRDHINSSRSIDLDWSY